MLSTQKVTKAPKCYSNVLRTAWPDYFFNIWPVIKVTTYPIPLQRASVCSFFYNMYEINPSLKLPKIVKLAKVAIFSKSSHIVCQSKETKLHDTTAEETWNSIILGKYEDDDRTKSYLFLFPLCILFLFL